MLAEPRTCGTATKKNILHNTPYRKVSVMGIMGLHRPTYSCVAEVVNRVAHPWSSHRFSSSLWPFSHCPSCSLPSFRGHNMLVECIAQTSNLTHPLALVEFPWIHVRISCPPPHLIRGPPDPVSRVNCTSLTPQQKWIPELKEKHFYFSGRT